ncbi:MAG: hypothetical protein MUP25_03330, partial [Syntrophales bacterium]|nr:hypothetical protein [Syntrophales bacterium]
EVSGSRENLELLQKVGKLLQADISGVPFTVIGKQYVIGWQDESTTGRWESRHRPVSSFPGMAWVMDSGLKAG